MGIKFNPLLFSGFDFVNPPGGVPIVPDSGSLPGSAVEGQLYVVQDTGLVYEWRDTPTPHWEIVAGPGVMLGVGTIDSQTPSADGAVDANNELVLQSASATVPGLVNNAAQTFSGEKTFQNRILVTSPGSEIQSPLAITQQSGFDISYLRWSNSSNTVYAGIDGTGLLDIAPGQFVLSSGNQSLNFATNNTVRMRVEPDGRVTSENYIAVKNNNGLFLSSTSDSANGLKGIIGWVPEDPFGLDTYGGPAPAIALQAERTGAGGAPHDLLFKVTNNHPILSEAMRLTSDGKLGIGTATPATILDVAGDVTVSNGKITVNAPGAGQVDALVLSSNANTDIIIKNTGAGVNGLLIGNTGGATADYQLYNLDAGTLAFTATGGIIMNNDVDMTSHRVRNLLDPALAQDAMTLAYANSTYIPLSEKAQPLGVATLDGGGKIPANQLPNTVMELQGFWDANTNTPALTDGTGNPGDVWEADVAGTTDFGNGPITFAIGDWAVYAADGKYHKSLNSNAVTSVNGFTGTVVLDTDDIAEGATNLYYTDARAKTATVADAIVDGIIDVAPSQNAVFDALALKANTTLNNLITTSIPTSLHFNTSNPGNAVFIDTPDRIGDAGYSLTLKVGAYSTVYGESPLRLQGGIEDGGPRGPIELQGKVRLQNGSQGTAGHVWTSTDTIGTGSWAALPASGANTALSNLIAPTSINESLIPQSGYNTIVDLITGAQSVGPGLNGVDQGRATKVLMPSAMTLSRVKLQTIVYATGGSYQVVIRADDNGGSIPGTLIASSSTYTPGVTTGSLGDVFFTFSSPVSLANATNYWICIEITVNAGNIAIGINNALPNASAELFSGTYNPSPNKMGIELDTLIKKDLGTSLASWGEAWIEKIHGLSTPVVGTDAANKAYVDAAVAGGGANTSLSNLVSTQINTELYFDSAANAVVGTEDSPTSSTQLALRTGNTSAGNSGVMSIESGTAVGGSSGDVLIGSGAGDAGTGLVVLKSGNPGVSGAGSGGLQLLTGDVGGAANSGTIIIWTGSTDNQPSGQISIATGSTTGSGTSGDLQVITGTAAGTGTSGNLDLATGGSGVGTGGNTGNITLHTSDTNNAGSNSGNISIYTGVGNQGLSGTVSISTGITGLDNTTDTGAISIFSGAASAGANTGAISIETGAVINGDGTKLSGALNLITGNNDAGASGAISVNSGTSVDQTSGQVSVSTGNATNAESGQLQLYTGSGSNASGSINMVSGDQLDPAAGGSSGGINIATGASFGNASSSSGAVSIITGSAAGGLGSSGGITLQPGNADGTGNAGSITIQGGVALGSGTPGEVNIFAGQGGPSGAAGANINIKAGTGNAANAGDVIISGGDDSGPGVTGNVILKPGQVLGGGATEGRIKLNYGTPTAGHVWTATNVDGSGEWQPAAGGGTWIKQIFTLSAGDITNQYIDLSNVAIQYSIDFWVKGGGIMSEDVGFLGAEDYSVDLTGGSGGNTRLNFLNDLATGGASALVAGDKIVVKYQF